MRNFFVALGAVAGAGPFLCCSPFPSVCMDDECVVPEAGTNTCDPVVDPSCLTTDNGVFVDGHKQGADTRLGTKEFPYGTLNEALGALGTRSSIYICDGQYNEKLTLTHAVSLYGGFDCTSWTRNGSKPKVVSTDSHAALTLSGVSSAVTISDLAFQSGDAVDAGDSSIAVFVANSTDV
ncbi:MAG: hypothetical protein FWD69_14945, partial [Polyangiaceae bacterium]|nr:hypothetical protein [Polyangiaceae bacterium]